MANEDDDKASFSDRIRKLTDEQRALYEAMRKRARAKGSASAASPESTRAPDARASVGSNADEIPPQAEPKVEPPPPTPPPPPGGWMPPGMPGAPPGFPGMGMPPGMPGMPPGMPGMPPGMPGMPPGMPGMPPGMPGMPPGMPWPWGMPPTPPGMQPGAPGAAPDMPGMPSWPWPTPQPPPTGVDPTASAGEGASSGTTPGSSESSKHSSSRSSGSSSRPFGSASPVVPLNRKGSLPPLFLVAPVFGSVFPYHQLVKHLDPEQPVYGLQSPALAGHGEAHETIPEMAKAYIEAIRGVDGCEHGPYFLGGYSFGGWTAYEMARQLLLEDEAVAFLAILGTSVPPSMAAPMAAKAAEYYSTLLRDQAKVFTDTGLTDEQRLHQEAAKFGTPLQQVAAINNLAAMRYVPRPIPRGLSLFTTVDCLAASTGDKTLGWWMLCTGEVDVHIHDGNHFSILNEPDVQDLATKLSARLAFAHEHGR